MNREELAREVVRLSRIIEEKTELPALKEDDLVLLSRDQLRGMISILEQRIKNINGIKTKKRSKSDSIFSNEARLISDEIEREYRNETFSVSSRAISDEFKNVFEEMKREMRNKKKK
jgi:hypothetical protein